MQCKRVHEHMVEAGKVALLQVQADEIRIKAVGAVYWLASAMEVRSRLWLAGHKPLPRSRVDPLAAGADTPMRPRRAHPDGDRRPCKLQKPGSEGLPEAASQWQGRPSEAGSAKA